MIRGTVISVDSRICRGVIRLEDGRELPFGPIDVRFANDELRTRGSSAVLDGRWVERGDEVRYEPNHTTPFVIVAGQPFDQRDTRALGTSPEVK